MFNKKLITFALWLMLMAAAWVAYQMSIANATSAVVTVTVMASEMKYEPATLRVKRGQTVNLIFRNASTLMVHEFKLNGFDIWTKAGAGLENAQTFVAASAGTYKFTCNIPGHEGMVGEFIVE